MKKLAFLLAFLLAASCILMTSCGDSNVSSNDTSSTAGTTPNGNTGVNNGNTSGVDPKYLDSNGMYTVENLGMPEFNFAEDIFTVCVYNNFVKDTY